MSKLLKNHMRNECSSGEYALNMLFLDYYIVGIDGPTQWNIYKINSLKVLQWLHTCDSVEYVKMTGFTKVAYALSKDLEVIMKLKF